MIAKMCPKNREKKQQRQSFAIDVSERDKTKRMGKRIRFSYKGVGVNVSA